METHTHRHTHFLWSFHSQFRTHKVIYRRYAGLFFSMCVDITDNELVYLESIHLFVEILDHFFSNVCELDLVFNFHKASNNDNVNLQGFKIFPIYVNILDLIVVFCVYRFIWSLMSSFLLANCKKLAKRYQCHTWSISCLFGCC